MDILIAGDYCTKHRVADMISQGKYQEMFGNIKQIVEKADYSIVNFEFPIVINEEAKPIVKNGPCLKGSLEVITALKYVGFKCCTLANNHILDYGEQCGFDTEQYLKKSGIDTVGFGNNKRKAARILYKEIKGKTLAIINCCEHEFSIATKTSAGSNPLNPIQQFYAIKEARNKADHVLVIVHGGHEQYNLPSPRMKETYRFFVDAGADAVVNHHQHCYSGYEKYNGKTIFYGLGNFCFDADDTDLFGWNYGYMVSLNFADNDISFEIIPYEQCKEKAMVKLLPKNAFNNELEGLNAIIADDEKLEEKTRQYYHDSMKSVAYTIEPIQNRYIAALQHRGLLPSLWSKKWLVKLQNYVMCEAHRDKLEYFLKHFKDE